MNGEFLACRWQYELSIKGQVFMSLIQRYLAWLTTLIILFFVRVLTGVRPRWHSVVPEAVPRVYFANHGSHGDFVLIWASLPRQNRRALRPVAGQDYWMASALRRFIGQRVFNALLINRHTIKPGVSPVDDMAQALNHGDSLILFPEGTRNTSDAPLLPFKSGLFHLSRQCPQVLFVPVWIDNIRRVIPKGHWLPVPMICSVNYGSALLLDPNETKDSFIQRAQAAVLALRPPEN